MPKSRILCPLVSSKKIMSKTVQNNAKQSPSGIVDETEILVELKARKRPIIWSFGLPTRTILDVRKKYSRKLATSLGFRFINLDEQIVKWIDQYKEDLKIKRFKEIYKHVLVPENIANCRMVRVEVNTRINSLIFKLMDEKVTLRIVPTRSSKAAECIEKKIICNNGNILQIHDRNLPQEFQPFHIVEQLSRKKVLELLKFSMYDNLPATGFIIDGFPKDKTDVELFEKTFYKAAGAIYWVHSESNIKDEQAEWSIRDYEDQMARQYNDDFVGESQIESLRRNSKIPVPETRKTSSSPGRRSKINSSVDQRRAQSTEWEIQSNNDRKKLKSIKKVTIAGTAEYEIIDSGNESKRVLRGFNGEILCTGSKKKSNKNVFQNSKLKTKICHEFPKYAMRQGLYMHEENENIISKYGHKAIKLEEADLLKFHPRIADILNCTLKDLLIGILRKGKSKFGKCQKKSLAAFSSHSINFSAAEFRYKPLYPGPNSDLPSNILSKVKRVIHPLLVHHERITEPTIISVQLLIDAVFKEQQNALVTPNVKRSNLKSTFLKRNSQKEIPKQERRVDIISGDKIIIRGRRHLSTIRNLTDNNSISFNLQSSKQLTSYCEKSPGHVVFNERRKSSRTVVLEQITKIDKSKSVLELELEIDQSDIFLFNSVVSFEQDENLLNLPPVTLSSNQEKLPTTNIPEANPLNTVYPKENEKCEAYARTKTISPKEMAKLENLLQENERSVNNNNLNDSLSPGEQNMDLSLIHDSVFCPNRYEGNNNVIVEVAIENDPGDSLQGVDDENYPGDSCSIQSFLDESNSSEGLHAFKRIPTQGYASRKRICGNSRQIDDRERQYERPHNWAVPYFDTSLSYRNYKSFNSMKTNRKCRFWNILEFERYIEQEHLETIEPEGDDNLFDDHYYTDAWRGNWIATAGPSSKNVSFLKRMCDCLCLCLKKYNKDN